MKTHILPAIRLTFAFMLFFSVIYTLVVWSLAQLAPGHGKGFTIEKETDGLEKKETSAAYYYENIAQKFSEDKYFYSRPSAVNYNAAGAGGSNKGPSEPGYLKQVAARIDTFMLHNPGIDKSEIPADLVTASGSGLDPDISVQAANVQVRRIAKIRSVSEAAVRELILGNTEKALWDIAGPEKINVLKLNIALDNLK